MFDPRNRLGNPEDIRNHLLQEVVPTPGEWAPYVEIAIKLGVKIIAIRQMGYDKIDIGTSPGNTWAYNRELFITSRSNPEDTVLHEVCHWIVAMTHGLQKEENFGSTNYDERIEDEIDTCDTQITWLLANVSPQAALRVAYFLQYDTSDATIEHTIQVGREFWESCGMPLEVSPELAQALAEEVSPGWTPDQGWCGPEERFSDLILR